MKYQLSFAFLFLLSTKLFCQSDLLFKKLKVSDSTKLLCVTDYFDSQQINKRFSFFCDNKREVLDIVKSFRVGKRVPEIGEGKEIHIYVLKGKEVQQIQVLINPRYRNVNTDVLGQFNYYFFDTTQLLLAHKKYPVFYKTKWLTFGTKKELDIFIKSFRNDNNLLCYQDNTAVYPGSGIIYINKDKDVNSARKGEMLLENAFSKLKATDEKDYSIGLLFDESGSSSYKFRVECSKELFDKINNPKLQKGKWVEYKYELLTYWRD